MSNHLKYLSSFFFPCCVVLFLASGSHSASSALIWTIPLWFIILVDWLSPAINPEQHKHKVSSWFYDAILYILALIQFLIISLLIINASQLPWGSAAEIMTSIVNLIVMRILVGTTSGSSAIIVAHEFIHRSKMHQQILGRLLLCTVCYEHFVIAHMHGHHLSVATPNDIATARSNENLNTYWNRVVIDHFKYAWNTELKRLNLIKIPTYHYKMLANTVLQGVIIECSLVIGIIALFGWVAGFIFLYQAFSGVRLLETINYYQHWGLEQGKSASTLAWVNQSSFTEYALIGLANHISHHQNAAKTFYDISYSGQGPKMPYGYFVTNLWVKLNNESYRKSSERILKMYFKEALVK